MAIARFKDLCLDAADAGELAGFWAGALGFDLVVLGDGGYRLDRRPGQAGPDSIWVDPVGEPRIGKTRVHLDLRLAKPDPGPLLAAGAGPLREPGDHAHWWVLTDPDGNQFCAFPPGEGGRPDSTVVYELVVDCADAPAQAAWWANITGGRVEVDDDGAASVVDAAGFPWQYWVFAPVPEPKTVKNRMHWDVDLIGTDPAELIAAGATLLREPDDTISWWVLADPEGNEFCAFAPRP